MWHDPVVAACVLDELETVIKEVAVKNKLVPIGGTKPVEDVNQFNINICDHFPILAGRHT